MFDFSKALAEAKDKSGLNYEQFAEKIGVSATALRNPICVYYSYDKFIIYYSNEAEHNSSIPYPPPEDCIP